MDINTSALFLHANPYLNPQQRSPSKPFVYVTKMSPRKRYVSPFQDGKPQRNYVSPTFMSGDCFYPHIPNPPAPNNKSQRSTSPAYTPQHHTGYNTPTKTNNQSDALYEQYRSRQQSSKTPIRRQPVIKIQAPQEFDTKSQNQSPSSHRSTVTSPTVSKKSHTPSQSNYTTYQTAQQTQHNSPKSYHSKTQSHSSACTQKVCTNCFNLDLIEDRRKQNNKNKQQDRVLLETNLATEKRRIREEIDYEQLKKHHEQQLMRQEFLAHQQKKELERLQKEQEKEQQRRNETEQNELLERQKNQQIETQLMRKQKFKDDIEQQMAERERIKQAEKSKQQLQQLENALDIGEEFKRFQVGGVSNDVHDFLKVLRRQKEREDHQDLTKIHDQTIETKTKMKEAQLKKDRDYAEFLRRQDELNKQILQFEKLEKNIKRQQLTAGLDEQIKLKQERQRREQRENQINIFDATTTPRAEPEYDNCDGCSKQYIKEYLSRVKRPKSKMHRSPH